MDQQRAHIFIPEGVTIDSLGLTRDPHTGDVRFDWTPLERICAASGIDPALLREHDEGNVAGLLVAWYAHHLAEGGAHNAVLDELTAEATVEAAIDQASASGQWKP